MASWLGVTTSENYKVVTTTKTWGVTERSLDKIKRVQVGDNLVVHVPPMQCGGIFRVTKPCVRDERTNPPFVYRVAIEPVTMPTKPVSIRQAFPAMIGANPAGYFRVSFREIPDHELEAFKDFLESGKAETLEPTMLSSQVEDVQFPSFPGERGKLADASETTLRWLVALRDQVAQRSASLSCTVSAHYASFRSPDTEGNFVYLHVQQDAIRTFTPLGVNEDPALKPTPSSGSWAKRFPSIFLIRGVEDVQKATDLVLRSHAHELELVTDGLEGGGEPPATSSEEASGFALTLERDLEDYLVDHLDEVEPGLRLYRNGKVTGRQFTTDVGRIDLLAIDASGAFVVVEAKAGEADRAVLGQVLPYMAWVEERLAKGKPVRGIIVASDFAPPLFPTVRALPIKLKLCRYWTEFGFKQLSDDAEPSPPLD